MPGPGSYYLKSEWGKGGTSREETLNRLRFDIRDKLMPQSEHSLLNQLVSSARAEINPDSALPSTKDPEEPIQITDQASVRGIARNKSSSAIFSRLSERRLQPGHYPGKVNNLNFR